jgi:glycyl-tRNA synthetase beta chain
MAETQDLLFELGTEELPPGALLEMSEALGCEIARRLDSARLPHGEVATYCTPRRLAVVVTGVPASQPDQEIARRGPAVDAAYDSEGRPTKAAIGFARSCGVALTHLEEVESGKGRYLMFRSTQVGEATTSLLPRLLDDAVAAVPVPRRMRWSDLSVEFSRPVRWAVLLLGREVVTATVLGVGTGRISQGHRYHKHEGIPIESPESYPRQLLQEGKVVVDFATRREMIAEQVQVAAASVGGQAELDPQLLDETTSLVEWPMALLGGFEKSFLALPEEVLIATMKGHQRYFHVRSREGKLLPYFITISNIDSKDPEAVREGNQRVLRPRLADAEFFFRADARRPIESLQESLTQVVFQEKLGSMAAKAERIARLSGIIAIAMGEDQETVRLTRRAGLLSKFDLMTQMVGEFPELQGIMGGHFLRQQGEPEALCSGVAQSYRPRFAGDAIPDTPVGRALALADKLDTLVGIFGIGGRPGGEKDPFALRRAALGVLRVIIEGEMPLNLRKLVNSAVEGYGELLGQADVADEVVEFMHDRLRGYFGDQGVPVEVVAAVHAREPAQPLDFARRTHAVHAFYRMPEAEGLASANKRIQNILRQAGDSDGSKVNEELLQDDAEWDLAAKVIALTPRVHVMLKDGNYTAALETLADLRDSVDLFFDQVKVMDDDPRIKTNRVAILRSISDLFMETADISRLQA